MLLLRPHTTNAPNYFEDCSGFRGLSSMKGIKRVIIGNGFKCQLPRCEEIGHVLEWLKECLGGGDQTIEIEFSDPTVVEH